MDMNPSVKTLLQSDRFTVIEHRLPRPDGSVAKCATVRHPGAVVVLPVLDQDRICLIQNHRLTVGGKLVELPAGTREIGESPEQTAIRELAEETGYRAGRLDKLAEFYTSPGVLDERMHAFVASELEPGPPAREENEQIENLILTWPELHEMIDRGVIQDGKTLLTVLLYQRRYTEPRAANQP